MSTLRAESGKARREESFIYLVLWRRGPLG